MGYNTSAWASEDTPMEFLDSLRRGQVRLTSGDATLVESSIGDSADPYFVFLLNGQMYQIDGSHSSWGGTTYDTVPFPVEAETVTKVVYKRK